MHTAASVVYYSSPQIAGDGTTPVRLRALLLWKGWLPRLRAADTAVWLKLSLERQEPRLFLCRRILQETRAVVCCFGFETDLHITSVIRSAYDKLMHVAFGVFSWSMAAALVTLSEPPVCTCNQSWTSVRFTNFGCCVFVCFFPERD